jgi:hypothetical protein
MWMKKLLAFVCILSIIFSQVVIINTSARDKTAPVLKVATPKINQNNVATNVKISLKFNENIYKSKYFAKIKLTKSNKATTIKCSISKYYLNISHKYALSYNAAYVLTVPAYSIKDKAGNILKKAITIKFKTKVKTTPTPTPTKTPTPTPSPTPTMIVTPTPTEVYNPDKIQVLFIGNSLTYDGGMPGSFSSLAQLNGKQVQVLLKTHGGYKLMQHYIDLYNNTNGEYSDILARADVVVLQGYGDVQMEAEAITNIQELFSSETKFCYLFTEYNYIANPNSYSPTDFKNLTGVQNMIFIPSGYAYRLLINDKVNNGFEYNRLIRSDGVHPTSLYGYIAACAVYKTILEDSCEGLSYDFLDDDAKALIPGTGTEEKTASILIAQQAVMQAIGLMN